MTHLNLLESAPDTDWREAAKKAILALTPPGDKIEVAPVAVVYRHEGRQWTLGESSDGILELTLGCKEAWSYCLSERLLADAVCPEVLLADTQDEILAKEKGRRERNATD